MNVSKRPPFRKTGDDCYTACDRFDVYSSLVSPWIFYINAFLKSPLGFGQQGRRGQELQEENVRKKWWSFNCTTGLESSFKGSHQRNRHGARTEVNRKGYLVIAVLPGRDSASKRTLALRHNMVLISANKPLQEPPFSNCNQTLPL